MSSSQRNLPAPNRPRSRRSLAQIPQGTESDKENHSTERGTAYGNKHGSQKNLSKENRLRSKSLGPGGLDALNDANGSRRKSTAAAPLKSILKPSVPLSPPRNIPSFEESRKKTPTRRSPRKSTAGRPGDKPGEDNLLIDFSTPAAATVVGSNTLANPFDTFDPLPGDREGVAGDNGESEQQKSERVERERREKEKQTILQQREARRKSMANRRVSFAPEATLHTWNVVELGDDYTSSSGSVNSTRRESTLAGADHDEGSADTPEMGFHGGEQEVQHSPVPGAVNHEESFSSSPFSGSSVTGSDDTATAGVAPAHDDASFSDSDDADNTAMSIENVMQRSMSSHSEGSSTDSSGQLDQSLRQAAAAAGTRGIDYDENGEVSAEFNHEIAGAFKPWVKKGSDRLSFDAEDLSSRLDQENVNPFPAPQQSQQPSPGVERGQNAVQSLSNRQEKLSSDFRGDGAMAYLSEERSRRSSADSASVIGGHTMEFTNVVGGIENQLSPSKDFSGESEVAGDEEMTMEFTSVFGGVVPTDKSPTKEYSPYKEAVYETAGNGEGRRIPIFRETNGEGESDVEMDITGPIGGILPPIEEDTEPLDEETMGMELTNAVGKILTPMRVGTDNGHGGTVLEKPDPSEPESSPFQEQVVPSPVKPEVNNRVTPTASENGSPTFANVKRNPRRSGGSRTSTSPTKPGQRQSSPPKTPTTPTRQSPRKAGATAPETPPSRRSASRHTSPEKRTGQTLFQPQTKQSPGPLFHHDKETGQSTPSHVLRPQMRSPSGLGIDKEGLGSPRVAEILDRRRSIGDDAHDFVPQSQSPRGVRFEDPKHLEREIDEPQSHQGVSTDGATLPQADKDPALNLRQMISSLSPKKNKLKTRKSLHVGSAKGLLGKRPVELDNGEEKDDTPKRLKGREKSPVKNVKLPAPPSKTETVGRTPRLSVRTAAETSPSKHVATTPNRSADKKELPIPGHPDDLRDRDEEPPAQAVADDHHAVHEEPITKPIQLSEFLEMTNIHFMELTTTKRRHTLAPDAKEKRTTDIAAAEVSSKPVGLEDCVAAGFCTVPMLELYQHSCRELKSYISEGRSVIRSIEDETFADNPPLFQEYVNAPPDIRLLMDNQFRNVKTHARLQSKSMWYEWRMKLLEGLKQGLDSQVEEMKADDTLLSKKEKHIDNVVPKLVENHSKLKDDAQNLERIVDETKNCDQNELREAREKLTAIDTEIAEKKKQVEEMQASLQDKSNLMETGTEAKTRLLQEIGEAERIREECRGWSVNEVQSLKASVLSIEQRTGWAVVSVVCNPVAKYGTTMAMRYRSELRLDFSPNAFCAQDPKARRPSNSDRDVPLTLSYSPEFSRHSKSHNKIAPTAAKSLMLHAMRQRLSLLSVESTGLKTFLAGISKTWDTVCALQNEIRLLEFCGVTRCKTVGPQQSEPTLLKVRCILLAHSQNSTGYNEAISIETAKDATNSQSRVDIDFTVKPRHLTSSDPSPSMEVEIDADVSVFKIYGFTDTANKTARVSETKMRDFLNKTIQSKGDSARIETRFGNGLWRDAVKGLQKKILVH